jgi:ABC-type transport system involved in cytochrome bd biosynthesis fused ATPase/permease subunit
VFQNQKPEPINLAVKQGTLSIVTGSVGSGKSSLLKAMLGELKLESGTVTLSAPEVAYCSQSPWIPNNSIQACVLGNNQFDEIWYKTVIEICDLAQDLTQMPQNDQTRTGSRGIKLSGGQKHRIVS